VAEKPRFLNEAGNFARPGIAENVRFNADYQAQGADFRAKPVALKGGAIFSRREIFRSTRNVESNNLAIISRGEFNSELKA
jgi:hypothetical protein